MGLIEMRRPNKNLNEKDYRVPRDGIPAHMTCSIGAVGSLKECSDGSW